MVAMLEKFRGSLLGVLCGDCVGAPFEGASAVPLDAAQAMLARASRPPSAARESRVLSFTDDSAMTMSVARSLVHTRLDQLDLLRRFSESFAAEPWRGYGGNIVSVFAEVRALSEAGGELRDATELARRQFDGRGSYGNGGAMRVAPAALFHHRDLRKALQAAEAQSVVTHTHAEGVLGSVLQAAAVWLAANADPAVQRHLDAGRFLDDLALAVQPVALRLYPDGENPFEAKLAAVRALLAWADERGAVVAQLGHGVSALTSVPTALYVFLRSVAAPSPVARAVVHAVTLGGDTDTIAAMAGAIAGAYAGTAAFPAAWLHNLEGARDMVKLAEELHEASEKEPPATAQ